MGLDTKLIDELLKGRSTVEEIAGENGLLKQLTKAILKRALHAELTTHLGYEKHEVAGHGSGNSRNGASRKRLKGDFGTLEIEGPRDRVASFEPQMVAKGQTRWHGFDDRILSLYARGMTTREIQGHLEEMYQVEVSPTLISNVTEAVMEEVKAWQSRPLDAVYAIVYLDALVVKMRIDGRVENRAVYVAIGITLEGQKEVHLHHQRHREPEHEPAQGDQDARRVPQRRRGLESNVPRAAQPGRAMETHPGLERGPQPLRAAVGSSLPTAARYIH